MSELAQAYVLAIPNDAVYMSTVLDSLQDGL